MAGIFLLPYFDEFDFLLPNTPVRHPLIFVTTPWETVAVCFASIGQLRVPLRSTVLVLISDADRGEGA